MQMAPIHSLEGITKAPPHVHLAEIIRAACLVYGVARVDFISHRRFRAFADARHVYFWVARKFTTCSFPMIGRHCGGRDHSTVMHGARKVDLLFPEFQDNVSRVLEMLGIEYEVAD